MKHDNILCRYGSSCKKIQEGTCHFLHPELPNKHSHKHKHHHHSRSRSREKKRNDKTKQQYQQQNNHSKQPTAKTKKYSDFASPKQKFQYISKEKYKERNFENHKYQTPNKHTEITQTPKIQNTFSTTEKLLGAFCREYHLNNQCQYPQHCLKIHAFLFHNPQKIKRRIFKSDLLLNSKNNLTILQQQDKLTYIIRGSPDLIFFQFTPLKNELLQTKKIKLNPELCEDYLKIDKTSYCFTFKNKFTTFYNIAIYNQTIGQQWNIENAHLSSITSILMLDQTEIISVSLDGELKLWHNPTGTAFINNKQQTQKIKNKYNPQNVKIELYTLFSFIQDSHQYYCVGCNHSKIFFFKRTDQIPFTETRISPQEFNIVKIKITFKNNKPSNIYLLAKNKEKSVIFKTELPDLQKEKPNFKKIFEHTNINQKSVNLFQIYNDLLIVAIANNVIFYRLQNPKASIGGILHKNTITDLIITQYTLNSTAVTFPLMAILQSSNQKQTQTGTFSIYLIK